MSKILPIEFRETKYTAFIFAGAIVFASGNVIELLEVL